MDYVISLVFGGVAFVLVLGFQLGLREAATGQVFSGAVQQDLVSATRTLEYDFQKIGFGCTDSLKIVQADTSAIEFKSDIDADGVVDLVSYSLGSPVPGSSNPAARMLFRKINGDPSMPIAGGVSRRARSSSTATRTSSRNPCSSGGALDGASVAVVTGARARRTARPRCRTTR